MKRAKVTAETFDKTPSAIDKLVGGQSIATHQEARPVEEKKEPQPKAISTAKGRVLQPTSFYIHPTQLDKLDDLAHDYKRRTGKRINRNDIVRALIDQADLQSVLVAVKVE